MSASTGGRATVFVVFAALAVAGWSALSPGRPGAQPSTEELSSLENAMARAARLHPVIRAVRPPGPAGWCSGCHPGVPHAGSGVAPALLNEHASRMDCLLCHWPPAAGQRPAPAWQKTPDSGPILATLPLVQATKERLTSLRAAAMAGRRCFERGPGCATCHRPGGLFALVRPGSPSSRVGALERLETYFTLAPGQKWYFPQVQ